MIKNKRKEVFGEFVPRDGGLWMPGRLATLGNELAPPLALGLGLVAGVSA